MGLNQDETDEIRTLLPHIAVLKAVLEKLPARPSEAARDMEEITQILHAVRWSREAAEKRAGVLRALTKFGAFIITFAGSVSGAIYLMGLFKAPPP